MSAALRHALPPEPPRLKPQFYSRRDVAQLLNVGIRTIQRWVDEGRLPPPIRHSYKVVRWPCEEIHRFIEELKAQPRKR